MTEIDRLADIISPQAVCGGIRLGDFMSRAELHIIIGHILTDLAENPPQCAVEALNEYFGLLTKSDCAKIFSAAINAIREAK